MLSQKCISLRYLTGIFFKKLSICRSIKIDIMSFKPSEYQIIVFRYTDIHIFLSLKFFILIVLEYSCVTQVEINERKRPYDKIIRKMYEMQDINQRSAAAGLTYHKNQNQMSYVSSSINPFFRSTEHNHLTYFSFFKMSHK